MKVKASFDTPNAFGFYNSKRYRNGDVFEFFGSAKEAKSKWIEPVAVKAEQPKAKPKAKPKHDGDKGSNPPFLL